MIDNSNFNNTDDLDFIDLSQKGNEKKDSQTFNNFKKFHLSKNNIFVQKHKNCKHCKNIQNQRS